MAVAPRRRYAPRLPRPERREQVLDAALRLIAAQGFSGLSMEGVAREADIAKTVVYDLFGDRQELLAALLAREQDRALAVVAAALPGLPPDGDPREVFVRSLATVLEEVRRHPDTWRLILLPAGGSPPAVRAAVDRHRRALVGRIEPVAAWGLDRLGMAHVDAELVAHSVLALFENAIRLTLTHPRRFPPRRLAAFAGDLVGAVAAEGPSPGRPRARAPRSRWS